MRNFVFKLSLFRFLIKEDKADILFFYSELWQKINLVSLL